MRASLRTLERNVRKLGRYRRSEAAAALDAVSGREVGNFVPYFPTVGQLFVRYESLDPAERDWLLALARREKIAIGVTDDSAHRVEEVACPDGVWRSWDEYGNVVDRKL